MKINLKKSTIVLGVSKLMVIIGVVFSLESAAGGIDKTTFRANSEICVLSAEIKTVTLVSPHKKLKEEFMLPIRYMPIRLEREGKIENSLTIAAHLESLEPKCKEDGTEFSWEESFTVNLKVAENKNGYIDYQKKSYSNSEVFEDIELEQYPNFIIREFKKKSAPVKNATYGVRYVEVRPKNSDNLPTPFFLQCMALADNKTLSSCELDFAFNDITAIKVRFSSSKLNKISEMYKASLKLTERFLIQ